MELRGEDLPCYLNNIQSVGLWKCPYDHQLADKAYFIDITVQNICHSFTHKMAAKASWHWNYVTVTLCIDHCSSLWQVCCYGFCRQEILYNCCSRRRRTAARQSAANAGSVTLSAVVGSLFYHLFFFFHFLDEQSLGIFDAGFTWAKQEVYWHLAVRGCIEWKSTVCIS